MEPLPALQQLRKPAATGSSIHEFTATLRRQSAAHDATPFRLTDQGGLLLAVDFTAPHGLILLEEGNAVALGVSANLPDASHLHLFFDNSVVELFLDDCLVFTERHYGRHPANPVLKLTLPPGWIVDNPRSYSIQGIWSA